MTQPSASEYLVYMRKLAALVAFIFLILALPQFVSASSFAIITKDGDVSFNVLGSEDNSLDKQKTLQVVDIAQNAYEPDAKVALLKSNGEVKLSVTSSLGEKDVDVTNLKDNLLEIEKRPTVERMTIKHEADKFILEQDGVEATTDYEISIDPKYANVSLLTPSGQRFLSVFPKAAADLTINSGFLTQLDSSKKVEITESSDGELKYVVYGKKILNILNLVKHPVDVTAHVSVVDGKILSIDEPVWLKFAGFLFG